MIPFERRYEVVDDDSYAAWYPVIKEKDVWIKIYLLFIVYKTSNISWSLNLIQFHISYG